MEFDSERSEPPALNDPDQNDYNGYDQQQVDETTYGVGRYQPQRPQDQQNYRDRFKHVRAPVFCLTEI